MITVGFWAGQPDGVLSLTEDSIGLKAEATVNDAELAEKARKKELRGWSFGFIKKKDRWEGENPRRRYLEDLELREVSILDVTTGIYCHVYRNKRRRQRSGGIPNGYRRRRHRIPHRRTQTGA